MLCIVTQVREYTWHVGEKIPSVPVAYINEIQVDGDELEWLADNTHTFFPSNNRVVNWKGQSAQATYRRMLDATATVAPADAHPILASIRSKLESYRAAHASTMQAIRDCSHAIDICTLAATGSRQLAVIQVLEAILFDATGEE